jgi:hypothetical protein
MVLSMVVSGNATIGENSTWKYGNGGRFQGRVWENGLFSSVGEFIV